MGKWVDGEMAGHRGRRRAVDMAPLGPLPEAHGHGCAGLILPLGTAAARGDSWIVSIAEGCACAAGVGNRTPGMPLAGFPQCISVGAEPSALLSGSRGLSVPRRSPWPCRHRAHASADGGRCATGVDLVLT